MKWRSSYSVGVPALDSDHKRLIEIINRVDRAGEDHEAVQGVLQDLTEYARVHFRREEDRLRDAGYPDLEDHVGEHEAFVDWLRTTKKTLADTPTSHRHIAQAISHYLELWLADHILATDMKYKAYLAPQSSSK